MTVKPRPWPPLVKVCAAACALAPLIGGGLVLRYALSLRRLRNGDIGGHFDLSGLFLGVAVMVTATAVPYIVASVGIHARRRWALWLLGVAAVLQGGYEAVHFLRAFARVRLIHSHLTLANSWMFLVIAAHLLLLGLTVFAAARLLAATRAAERQDGFALTVANA